MVRKFPGKNFENLGVPHGVVLFYGIYANSHFFLYSALASSFGHDHSELHGHLMQG